MMTVLGDLGMLRETQEAQLRELVSQAIAAGAPTHELARVLGISRATVWRRFREELRAAQQTGVTSSAFGIHPAEAGCSPIVAEAKRPRVDRGTPRSRCVTAADGAGPGAPVGLVNTRGTMQRARAAQREAVVASRRATQLTRAIAIELGNASRRTRQRALPASARAAERSLFAGDEGVIGRAGALRGSNVPAWGQTAQL